MTVSLALVDYIPVILFAATSVLLMRDLYNKMSKGAFALMSAGLIMVIWAGAYKATWKLFYTMNIADLYLMNNVLLPMQAAGFLILGIGLIAATFFDQGKGKSYVSALPVLMLIATQAPKQERAAVVFIIFMVLGYLGFCGCLTVIAARMKKIPAVVLFVLSFVLLMGMGYLGSREFGNDPKMNWIEEGVNLCAQLCLLSGVLILHKSGLKERADLK